MAVDMPFSESNDVDVRDLCYCDVEDAATEGSWDQSRTKSSVGCVNSSVAESLNGPPSVGEAEKMKSPQDSLDLKLSSHLLHKYEVSVLYNLKRLRSSK